MWQEWARRRLATTPPEAKVDAEEPVAPAEAEAPAPKPGDLGYRPPEPTPELWQQVGAILKRNHDEPLPATQPEEDAPAPKIENGTAEVATAAELDAPETASAEEQNTERQRPPADAVAIARLLVGLAEQNLEAADWYKVAAHLPSNDVDLVRIIDAALGLKRAMGRAKLFTRWTELHGDEWTSVKALHKDVVGLLPGLSPLRSYDPKEIRSAMGGLIGKRVNGFVLELARSKPQKFRVRPADGANSAEQG